MYLNFNIYKIIYLFIYFVYKFWFIYYILKIYYMFVLVLFIMIFRNIFENLLIEGINKYYVSVLKYLYYLEIMKWKVFKVCC